MELMHDKNEQETRKSLNRYLGGQLLNAYLDKAVVLTAGKSKSEAKRLIEEYHHNADKKLLTQAADTLDIVKDKEKALKDGASRFGLKTKINYASDADVGSLSEIVTTGMAGVAMAAMAPVAAGDPSVLSGTMLAALTGYTSLRVGKLAAAGLTASKTPEEKKQASDYADVKHAQLALKLLKKEIEAPIKAAERAKYREEAKKLFAAGYGQPSGGLVQAAMLKNQKAGR